MAGLRLLEDLANLVLQSLARGLPLPLGPRGVAYVASRRLHGVKRVLRALHHGVLADHVPPVVLPDVEEVVSVFPLRAIQAIQHIRVVVADVPVPDDGPAQEMRLDGVVRTAVSGWRRDGKESECDQQELRRAHDDLDWGSWPGVERDLKRRAEPTCPGAS